MSICTRRVCLRLILRSGYCLIVIQRRSIRVSLRIQNASRLVTTGLTVPKQHPYAGRREASDGQRTNSYSVFTTRRHPTACPFGRMFLDPQNQKHVASADPDRWVDEYGDYLYRYALSRLRNSTAAEEVVQETFLAGIRFQDRFTGEGAERAWLLGILKRKIVDYVRMRNRYDRDGSYEDTNDPSAQLFDQHGRWKADAFAGVTPDDQVESREIWGVVQGCLEHIPKGQADVFVLSVMEEMETDQICLELGITATNLWVRLHRARLALAKCVGSQWFADEEVSSHAQ